MISRTLSRKFNLGQIHVYTGDGKGKTTAGLGLALRATGSGKRVAIIFFDKGGFRYGERKSLLKLVPQLNFWVSGLIRFRPGKPFRFSITDGDRTEGRKGLDLVRALFKKKYDLVILDEINTAASLGLVNEKEVLALLRKKPATTELVMTGRRAPEAFINAADLVTEMKLIKHYFYKGVAARQGIEY